MIWNCKNWDIDQLFTLQLKQLAFYLAAALAVKAAAVVYTPGHGSSDRMPGIADFPGINTAAMFTGKICINGAESTMQIYQLNTDLEYLAAHLHKRFPNARLIRGKNFLRIAPRKPGEPGERWLFIAASKELPVAAFKLEVPEKLKTPLWPGTLPPPPPEAKPELVVTIPGSDTVIATFYGCQGQPHLNLARCAGMLRAQDFLPVGAESSPKIQGKGDMFIRMNPKPEVILISFGEGGSGLFFRNKLKK